MGKEPKITSIEEVKEQSTALVLAQKGYAVAQHQPEDLRAMILENMGGELKPTDLQRIKIPAGGGKAWEVADENGEVQSVKTISGVILLAAPSRTYWAEEFSGAGAPPDCSSRDGVRGQGNPGIICEDCPFNQWGSDGHAKACKEKKLLFLLQPGLLLPEVVVLSPGSLAGWRKYATLLTGRGRAVSSVVTEIGLKEAVSKDNIKYSQATFRATDALDAASVDWLRRYTAGMSDTISAAASIANRDEVAGPQE